MALPELIEIVPLDKPVRAEITVPGSKSITNRGLILAALADGEVTLTGALWSEDTQIMVECLQKLGFSIRVENDPEEFCNRTITVKGLGGKIPKNGTLGKPLELFVGNAGTVARFLSAFVCLGNGVFRLSGAPRMHERPQAALFQALRELGHRIEPENGNDKLPVKIFGGRSRGNETEIEMNGRKFPSSSPTPVKVSIAESSQFASALLLCARAGGWKIEAVGENMEESPYVEMTRNLIAVFPGRGGRFRIEPDTSSGSYFWATGWLFPASSDPSGQGKEISVFDLALHMQGRIVKPRFFSVLVRRWPLSDWQMDQWFPAHLPQPPDFPGMISRASQMGDSIMTAITIAPLARNDSRFTNLGRLRVQECERVVALRTELTKCGAKVIEEGDTLTVYPSPLRGAEIETYNDHRIAMCFAVLGLKVPGIKIKNPACVKKTFPNFFHKLAAAPPGGLGATLLDARSGQKLIEDELFAN